MSTSLKEFYIGLYLEHLEEASFLYEQRRSLFENPEITWTRIGEFEDRFEAHIDALVVGEELALKVCQERAAAGDAGELHAATRVFCRQNRKDFFVKTLQGLDLDDADKCRGLADALAHELPADWQDAWTVKLTKGDPKLIPVLANVIGFQRLKMQAELLQVLPKTPAGGLAAVLWALGRVGDLRASSSACHGFLKHDDELVRSAAALALLRLHDPQIINSCLKWVYAQSWPALPLGLGGGPLTAQVLLDAATTGKPSSDSLLAVGLVGDPAAVDKLIEFLSHPEVAPAAASALELITGAKLYEDVLVPDPIDEDELFESERERLKKGQPLPGRTATPVHRLSQHPEHWQKWWSDHRSRFRRIRYRSGKPFSPACLVENLESEESPASIRRLAYEELVIRYGLDVPFESEYFVVKQRTALAHINGWVHKNAARFQEGAWYYAGQQSAS
ncbi:MAG: hypothetical protein L0Y72_04450 [Gemmataceae bacterium]|nr:hypothetical protein [Gemmataceae bacterium]MCI0738271.1 hypothetical protein [Gemmataceae bacterium]